jgi:3-hydroxy-5-phosphonooxypentane-2,4-dione thiolase
MSWGLQNRLNKIIKPADGRTVMLAVDHGYFLGPTTGLECIAETIMPIAHLADTLMLTRGALRNDIDPALDTPIVLRVSGGNSVLEDDLSNETIVVGTEEVIRMNAAGMAVQVFIGAPHQHQTIASLGKLVDEGERYGIPVIGVTAVGKDMVRDARYLSLASRIIAETGGHIVKTYYCENFERVTSTCPVPVVMAGGKKLPEREALEMTFLAIQAGAAGVDMGRNIFQSDSPLGMIKAVRAVVHGNASVDDAFAVYMDERTAGGKTGPGIGSADDHAKI